MTMLIALCVACAGTPEEADAPAADVVVVDAISWVRIPAGEDLAAAVTREAAAARAADEQPVGYLGAGWCAPCVIYKKHAGDPAMVAAHAGVRIIEIDADVYASALPEAGFITLGIPFWVKLDDSGVPTSASIDGGAWEANTVENMAPALQGFFASP